MKGDYSKIPFGERKKMQHYRKVYHQQGKVLLDSDLNENTDLLHYQMKTLVKDGLCGSPNIGFRIGRGVPLLPVDDHRYIGEEKGWSVTPESATAAIDYFTKFEGKGSLKLEYAEKVIFTFQKPVDLSKYRYLNLALRLTPSNDHFPGVICCDSNEKKIYLDQLPTSDQNEYSVINYVFPPDAVLDNITKVIFEIDSNTIYHIGAVECSPPMFTLEPMTHLKGWNFDTDDPESAEISIDEEAIKVSQITRLYKRHFSTVDFSKFETMEFAIESSSASAIEFYVSDENDNTGYWEIINPVSDLNKYFIIISQITNDSDTPANLASIKEYGFRKLSVNATYTIGSILYEMSLENNFVISGTDPLSGETGRLYVDGELYEKEEAETYLNQKDCPWAPSITRGKRTDIVYVDVWQRHVTSAEDPELREVAVGVDTCNRMKAVAQVKVLEGSTSLPPDLRPTGECTLSTAVEYMETEKLCEEITPGVEYIGLENRLYRVEIHAPKTYKWSRNNASTVSQIIENVKEGAASVKVKEVKLFEIGDIIEITDDRVEFADRKYYLSYLFSWDDITGNDKEKLKEFLKQKFGVNWVTTAQIVPIDNGKTIMVSFEENYLSLKLNDEQTEVNLEIDDGRTDKFVAKNENSKLNIYYSSIKPWGELRKITSIDRNKNKLEWDATSSRDPLSMTGGLPYDYTAEGVETTHPRVIKWDGANNTSNEETLEDGIKIRFSGSDMLPGDYWTFTARENTRTVERLVNEPPQGVVHRYYPLATIEWDYGEIINVTDLRTRFEPLCGLTAADLGFDNADAPKWKDAKNVQQALENLQDPEAGGVKFESNCDFLYGDVDNVQAALDNLCNGITVPSLTLKGKDGEQDNWPKLECSDERNLVEINKGLQIVTGELKAPFFKAGQGNSAVVTEGKWYRIAENTVGGKNAEFTLRDHIGGGGHPSGRAHSTLTFRIGISYNYDPGMSFTVLNHSRYSKTTFTKIRILKKATHDTQYLEVLVNRTGFVNYSIYDNLQISGWDPVNWEEVPAIPDGYDDREFDVDNLFVVGDYTNRFTIERGGNVGIGTHEPKNRLDVEGGVVIGNGFSGMQIAPSNGLLVKGKVGIGTSDPEAEQEAQLVVNGLVKATELEGMVKGYLPRKYHVPLLRQTIDKVAFVPVNSSPYNIAFDGTHIWVTNFASSNVSKIDIDTHDVKDIGVGANPEGIAFDGTHIWVANHGSANVSKININTHDVKDIGLGRNPHGIAFDGMHIWVASTSRVSKIDIDTHDVKDIGVEGSPYNIAFDGTHIWVTNYSKDNVSKIDINTDEVKESIDVGSVPRGIAFDGTHIWVANYGSVNVSKINMATNETNTIGVGIRPWGIAFDGTHIWVANYGNHSLSKIDIDTHDVKDIVVGSNPLGIAFDGTHIWVANFGGENVSKINKEL